MSTTCAPRTSPTLLAAVGTSTTTTPSPTRRGCCGVRSMTCCGRSSPRRDGDVMRVAGVRFVQGRNAYRDRDSLKFGIAIHNTSNDASDDGEASYAARRPDGVSSHFYVDHDSVTQSLDTRSVAGHAGSDEGNQHAIAVEITGANGWSR